jgi:small subunit ribosomal protein S17
MNQKNNQKKEKSSKEKKGRLFKGTVVSDKMDKTIVVSVSRLKKHPRYKKRYRVDKKYKAHDEKNEFKIGDRVIIKECRPISKGKKWRVNNKL